MGIHFHSALPKHGKVKRIKGKCREGRETDPFHSRGYDPSTSDLGIDFPLGQSLTCEIHSHDHPWSKSLPFLTVLMYGGV